MQLLAQCALLLTSACVLWSLWSPVAFVGGCDIPGARDYGAFADVLQCTRGQEAVLGPEEEIRREETSSAITVQDDDDDGEEKKNAGHACELVVVTTVLQSVDQLRPAYPGPATTRAPPLTTCYYAIVDRPTAQSLFPNRTLSRGDGVHRRDVDCTLKAHGWNVVVVPDAQLPFQDPRRDSRVLKTLLHLFFPWAKYHLYLDGNRELGLHPADMVARVLIGNGTVDKPDYLLGIPRHPHRTSVEQEVTKVTMLKLDSPRVLQHQLDLYHLTEPPPMTPLLLRRFHSLHTCAAIRKSSALRLPVGRRVFLDFDNYDRSKGSASPLDAFLKRATVYGMHDGWEELPLREQGELAPRVRLAVQDLVVLRLYVAPDDDRPTELLRRYVAEGTVMLVDLVLVEYATDDPVQLRTPSMIGFRTTLREVVETWGVLAMSHWDAGRGWDERTWWIACRRHVALGQLLPSAKDVTTTTQAWESLTAWPASIWVIGAICTLLLAWAGVAKT